MTPVSLQALRDVLRRDMTRARLLWTEGIEVAATAEETGAALAGLQAADLSGLRMRRLAEAVPEGGRDFRLDALLLGGMRMHPGWLIRPGALPQQNPLAEIGAALSLVAMAFGLAGTAAGALVLAHDPAGGVRVRAA